MKELRSWPPIRRLKEYYKYDESGSDRFLYGITEDDGLRLFGRIETIEEEWAAVDSVQKRLSSLNAKLYELEGKLLPLKATVESDENKWKLFRSREHEANRQTLQTLEERRNLLEQIRVLTEEPPHLDD